MIHGSPLQKSVRKSYMKQTKSTLERINESAGEDSVTNRASGARKADIAMAEDESFGNTVDMNAMQSASNN